MHTKPLRRALCSAVALALGATLFTGCAYTVGRVQGFKYKEATVYKASRQLDKVYKGVDEYGRSGISDVLFIEHKGQFKLDYSQSASDYVAKARTGIQATARRSLEQALDIQIAVKGQADLDKLSTAGATGGASGLLSNLPDLSNVGPALQLLQAAQGTDLSNLSSVTGLVNLTAAAQAAQQTATTGTDGPGEAGEGPETGATPENGETDPTTPAFTPLLPLDRKAQEVLSSPKFSPPLKLGELPSAISERQATLIGLNDKVFENLIKYLVNPTSIEKGKAIVLAACQISCNPGRRTRNGWRGELTVSVNYGYEDENHDLPEMKPGFHRDGPRVLAAFPFVEAQNLDLRNSERNQIGVALSVAALLQQQGAKVQMEGLLDFVRRLETDAASRTTIPLVSSYANGNTFGFQFAPAFQALANPADRKKGAGNVLHPYSFPALIVLEFDTKDVVDSGAPDRAAEKLIAAKEAKRGSKLAAYEKADIQRFMQEIFQQAPEIRFLNNDILEARVQAQAERNKEKRELKEKLIKDMEEELNSREARFKARLGEMAWSENDTKALEASIRKKELKRIEALPEKEKNVALERIPSLQKEGQEEAKKQIKALLEEVDLAAQNIVDRREENGEVFVPYDSLVLTANYSWTNLSKPNLNGLMRDLISRDEWSRKRVGYANRLDRVAHKYRKHADKYRKHADKYKGGAKGGNTLAWQEVYSEFDALRMAALSTTRHYQMPKFNPPKGAPPAPTITSVAPDEGWVNADTVISVRGTNFAQGSKSVVKSVSVGGRIAEFVVAGEKSLVAVVPKGSGRDGNWTGHVSVVTTGGAATSAAPITFRTRAYEVPKKDMHITLTRNTRGEIISIGINATAYNQGTDEHILNQLQAILNRDRVHPGVTVTVTENPASVKTTKESASSSKDSSKDGTKTKAKESNTSSKEIIETQR